MNNTYQKELYNFMDVPSFLLNVVLAEEVRHAH